MAMPIYRRRRMDTFHELSTKSFDHSLNPVKRNRMISDTDSFKLALKVVSIHYGDAKLFLLMKTASKGVILYTMMGSPAVPVIYFYLIPNMKILDCYFSQRVYRSLVNKLKWFILYINSIFH